MTIMAHTNKCVGCNETINDLYHLIVGSSLYWHSECLKCADCACPLQTKCFLNQGKFYCLHDYTKLKQTNKNVDNNNNSSEFPTQATTIDSTSSLLNQCPTCHLTINSNDYVIKLKNSSTKSVYHLNCFLCAECHKLIAPGHQYAIVNENILCSQHYMAHLTLVSSPSSSSSSSSSSSASNVSSNVKQNNFLQQAAQCHFQVTPPPAVLTHHTPPSSSSSSLIPVQTRSLTNQNYQNRLTPDYDQKLVNRPGQDENNNIDRTLLLDHNNNSSQTTNFAIKQPHHSYTASNFHDHHHQHQISHEYGRHLNQNQNSKNLVLTSRSNLSGSCSSAGNGSTTKSSKTTSSSSSHQVKQTLMNSSGGSSCSSSSNNNNNNKKKRIRTSFKHQQLRVMKAHFQINQNPDSKELKELSERTGLQKRVLQVWFQNSRAKQRKTTTTTTTTTTTNPTLANTSMAMGGVGLMSAGGLGSSSLFHSKFHEKDESNSMELDDENFELDESSSGDDDDDDDEDDDNDDFNFDQEEEDEATNDSGNDNDVEISNKRIRKEADLESEETKQDKKENITKSQVSRGVKRHKKSLIIADVISPSSSAADYILLQHQQQQQLQQQTQLTTSSSSSSSSSFGQLSQIHTNFNHQQTPIDFYHCY